MFYAHSTSEADRSNWHELKDHLEATASLAKSSGEALGIGPAAALAGLLHDLGKYSIDFQGVLNGSGKKVDHSTAGAAVVLQAATGNDSAIAELIAYCIAGHHAGLPDRHGESFATLTERLKGFSANVLDPAWQTEIAPVSIGLVPVFVRGWSDRERRAFHFAFLGRMIFSCLVDADFKDTEAFYAQTEGRRIDRTWSTLRDLLPRLRKGFDRHVEGLTRTDTSVNRLRSDILSHVRSRASEPAGFFTLTVPTGGGKTLASLGFALDHAAAQGHRRIIYAIPFTSIIDQTASIFRDVLGEGVVLEHHSAFESEASRDETHSGKSKLKLAMEDWAAPIIVTTNVQLFESLFAARSSRCRKLHNVAGSIVILDEAQTIPRHLLAPAVAALRVLVRDYGCTIVLCTATQPALDERNFVGNHALGLPLAGRELAPDPPALAQELTRVVIRDGGVMGDGALIRDFATERQGLVIVNTRGHALSLYRAADRAGLEGLIHLTTRQYAADRRTVLTGIRTRLKIGEPCRVIATSLVEAGVDLDFPRVWRAEAGLDQIAQAAGRCNREGARPIDKSIVTLFAAPDNPPPAEIKGLSGDLRRILHKHPDLLVPAAMEEFFAEVYWRIGAKGLDRYEILADFNLAENETDFAYRTVAGKFRMIESGLVPVIVAKSDAARAVVDRLAIEAIPSGVLARELQSYVVQVPPRARARLIACGHVAFAEEKKRGDQFAVLATESLYRSDVGLLWEDADYLGLEQVTI